MAMTDLDREAVRPHPIEAGLRSLLDVPLLVGERVIGVISVGSRRRGTFMPDEIELLELAAERIAVAIVAARAYEGSRAPGGPPKPQSRQGRVPGDGVA